jgi:hypothetical protein
VTYTWKLSKILEMELFGTIIKSQAPKQIRLLFGSIKKLLPVCVPISLLDEFLILSAFRVKSLPDVPFSVGEMYSGLMPIKAGDSSRQLFFIFQPSIGPPTDTLTIWLNGGPGCSSLEGFFQENGRYVWHEGKAAPIINDHSWVNVTNMLW